MNETIDTQAIINDLLTAISSQGEMNQNMDTDVNGNKFIIVQGQLYDYNIFIEISERPYVKSHRSATLYPVDQASPAEDEIGGNFDFYITDIECFDKEGNQQDISSILTPEIIEKIKQSITFDTDEFIEDDGGLYESKKIAISEQDIIYMVKRIISERYNNKGKNKRNMNENNIIKINENKIRKIVETCVRNILKEGTSDDFNGTIVYHNKDHNGTTGGPIQEVFPKDRYLIFKWQADRGLAIENTPENLQALKNGLTSPPAALIAFENGGTRVIEKGGFAVYQSSLHWDPNQNKYVNEEVDMGQLDAMRPTPSSFDYPPEVKKQIRNLRHKIDEYEKQGLDTEPLTRKIRELKEKYGPKN